MRKILSIATALGFLLTVNGCKKCNECSLTCIQCRVSGSDFGTLCGPEHNEFYENFVTHCLHTGGTVIDRDSLENKIEICGKSAEAQTQLSGYLILGYECLSK